MDVHTSKGDITQADFTLIFNSCSMDEKYQLPDNSQSIGKHCWFC